MKWSLGFLFILTLSSAAWAAERKIDGTQRLVNALLGYANKYLGGNLTAAKEIFDRDRIRLQNEFVGVTVDDATFAMYVQAVTNRTNNDDLYLPVFREWLVATRGYQKITRQKITVNTAVATTPITTAEGNFSGSPAISSGPAASSGEELKSAIREFSTLASDNFEECMSNLTILTAGMDKREAAKVLRFASEHGLSLGEIENIVRATKKNNGESAGPIQAFLLSPSTGESQAEGSNSTISSASSATFSWKNIQWYASRVGIVAAAAVGAAALGALGYYYWKNKEEPQDDTLQEIPAPAENPVLK